MLRKPDIQFSTTLCHTKTIPFFGVFWAVLTIPKPYHLYSGMLDLCSDFNMFQPYHFLPYQFSPVVGFNILFLLYVSAYHFLITPYRGGMIPPPCSGRVVSWPEVKKVLTVFLSSLAFRGDARSSGWGQYSPRCTCATKSAIEG